MSENADPGRRPGFVEFVILVALIISLVALSIDAMLPALPRIALSPAQLLRDAAAILRTRAALGYTLTMGLLFGAFIGYLGSSQQILQQQYRLDQWFPLYFGILASAVGCASLLNARLVLRFGMRRLSRLALQAICLLSFPFCGYALLAGGHPPLAIPMAYLLPLFFCFGILFGNLNAMAMEPLGHIAGLGPAVIGSLSTLISVVFGAIVADAYDDTVLPLILGFALLGFAAMLLMRWTEAGLGAES